MSTLTQNEREGLDDVFLSIHTQTQRYEKFKVLASLITKYNSTFHPAKLLKQAKYGLKETNLSQFIAKLHKKKKNLSE